MSKMFQVYGVGQALIPVLPPPVPFENPPTSHQTNYEIGQIVFSPPASPTGFWLYGGGGNWIEIATSAGDVTSVTGTANQILASPTTGAVVLSLIGPYTPATYTAHGVLVGEGTSSIVATAVGTNGQVLTGNTGADPAFAALGTNSGLTAHGVLLGEGNSAIAATAVGTTGQVLTGNSAADPSFAAIGTNSGLTSDGILLGGGTSAFTATAALSSGQTLVGVTGGPPIAQMISGSQNTSVRIFGAVPVASAKTGGVAAVTINTTNLWAFPQWGAYFEAYNTVALQAIVPALSATAFKGLNLDSATGANSAAIEITEGISLSAKNLFTIGSTFPFYVQATFSAATLADVTDVIVGFRAASAYQATVFGASGYTDYAFIGILGGGTPGEFQIQTQVGSAGNVVTDTTQHATAATSFTVRVNVSGAGVVTYLINGVAPTVTAAYTFTSSLNVVPCIYYQAASGGHAEVDLIAYQCGLQ